MTGLLILIANLFVLMINVGVTGLTVKLITEIYKKGTIERIGK